MSVEAMRWAIQVDVPSTACRVVLMLLADYKNEQSGACFPALPTLAFRAKLSDSGTRLAIKQLTAEGLISREFRQDLNRTDYTLHTDRGVLVTNTPKTPRGVSVSEGGVSVSSGEGVHSLTPNQKINQKEPATTRSARGSKAGKKPSYTVEFEEFWNEVPKHSEDPNANPGSKSDAFKAWQRLDEEDRSALFSGWQEYLGWLETKRQKRADYPIMQFVTFINQRGWENYQKDAA
jgi:hypothetical protein